MAAGFFILRLNNQTKSPLREVNQIKNIIPLLILIFISASIKFSNNAYSQKPIREAINLFSSSLWQDREFAEFINQAPVDEDIKYYRAGLERKKQGDYENALSFFTKALNLNRGLKIAKYNRGFCYEKLTDFRNAGKDYIETIGYNPFNINKENIITDIPVHYDIIANLYEIHPDYCIVSHYTKTSGRNRAFKFFFEMSPNLRSTDSLIDLKISSNINHFEKKYIAESGQAGFGLWHFFLHPLHPPRENEEIDYILSYKIRNLPHLHGNTLVSIGSNPIRILTDRWILAFAFPENTMINNMTDFRPYKYEKNNGWLIFFYDYCGIKKPTPLHISFSLKGDRKGNISAKHLNY